MRRRRGAKRQDLGVTFAVAADVDQRLVALVRVGRVTARGVTGDARATVHERDVPLQRAPEPQRLARRRARRAGPAVHTEEGSSCTQSFLRREEKKRKERKNAGLANSLVLPT